MTFAGVTFNDSTQPIKMEVNYTLGVPPSSAASEELDEEEARKRGEEGSTLAEIKPPVGELFVPLEMNEQAFVGRKGESLLRSFDNRAE